MNIRKVNIFDESLEICKRISGNFFWPLQQETLADDKYLQKAVMKHNNRESIKCTEVFCPKYRSKIYEVYIRMHQSIGTPYTKKLIVGKTHIYLASPIYGHRDYNKSVAFDNTERNRKISERLNKMFGNYGARQGC